MTIISPEEARTLIAKNAKNHGFIILDVRTPEEFAGGHIGGAQNIDSRIIGDNLGSLDRQKTFLLYCAAGVRSTRVKKLMKSAGFLHLYQIAGGYNAWKGSS
jgi:phage shock protein E